MKNIISLKDLRVQLTRYTKSVEKKGESFLVVRKSKPVFKIVPVEEDMWETVIDFTEIDPKGVPLEKIKATLEKMATKSK